MNESRKLLEFQGVSYRYDAASPAVFEDFTRSFGEGERYLLSGVNGSGKSTFMKLAVKLCHPDTGQVLHADSLKGACKIVYLEQAKAVPEILPFTVAEFLKNTADFCRSKQRLADLADYFRLHDLMNLQFKNLSGGEQELVILVRALLLQGALYCFDEAFTHLDSDKRELALTALLEWVPPQALVFLTDHQFDLSQRQVLTHAYDHMAGVGAWELLPFPLTSVR